MPPYRWRLYSQYVPAPASPWRVTSRVFDQSWPHGGFPAVTPFGTLQYIIKHFSHHTFHLQLIQHITLINLLCSHIGSRVNPVHARSLSLAARLLKTQSYPINHLLPDTFTGKLDCQSTSYRYRRRYFLQVSHYRVRTQYSDFGSGADLTSLRLPVIPLLLTSAVQITGQVTVCSPNWWVKSYKGLQYL